MAYQNDRRLVEMLTLPLGFSMMLVNGVSPEYKDKKDKIITLLTEVMNNLIGNMEHKRRDKILRRTREAMDAGFLKEATANSTHAAKVGLALYYLTRNMMDQEAFYFTEGSPFDQAMDLILPALEEWSIREKFNKSSIKFARQMLDRYQAAGYFNDVQWTLTNE